MPLWHAHKSDSDARGVYNLGHRGNKSVAVPVACDILNLIDDEQTNMIYRHLRDRAY